MTGERQPLSPRLRVRGRAGAPAEGLLGPLFWDPDLRCIRSLTPAHVVGDGPLAAIGGDVSISVGRGWSMLGPASLQPASNLLTALQMLDGEVDRGIYALLASMGRGEPAQVVTTLRPLFDRQLRVVTRNGLETARLVSIESQIVMPNPRGGEITVFNRALKLRADDDREIVRRGDAGGLVLTPDGDWVGVVVGGGGGVALAAPIHPVMERCGLEILTPDKIEALNAARRSAPIELVRYGRGSAVDILDLELADEIDLQEPLDERAVDLLLADAS